jgi:hypothetical protein
MTKKICVTSLHPVGCTFVDWSIHFLSGQSKFYNVKTSSWIDLIHDPITELNAHGHEKNHPSGLENTILFLNKIDQLPVNSISSIYPYPLHVDTIADILDIKHNQLSDKKIFTKIRNFGLTNYFKIFDYCVNSDVKIIYVDVDPRVTLYKLETRTLVHWSGSRLRPTSINDLKNEHQEIFFKESNQTWTELGLTNRWDIRERMSLDSRPFNTDFPDININCQHLWINSLDLWTRTEYTLTKIMKYLELDIMPDRLEKWLPVCKKWQEKQLKILDFAYNYQHIINSIVNNIYYEIDLTFEQEVVIQHCLIYQHNLNLKTWQLEKFPNNTQELHKLLEPNCHILGNY